jgi:hypothetical protein
MSRTNFNSLDYINSMLRLSDTLAKKGHTPPLIVERLAKGFIVLEPSQYLSLKKQFKKTNTTPDAELIAEFDTYLFGASKKFKDQHDYFMTLDNNKLDELATTLTMALDGIKVIKIQRKGLRAYDLIAEAIQAHDNFLNAIVLEKIRDDQMACVKSQKAQMLTDKEENDFYNFWTREDEEDI